MLRQETRSTTRWGSIVQWRLRDRTPPTVQLPIRWLRHQTKWMLPSTRCVTWETTSRLHQTINQVPQERLYKIPTTTITTIIGTSLIPPRQWIRLGIIRYVRSKTVFRKRYTCLKRQEGKIWNTIQSIQTQMQTRYSGTLSAGQWIFTTI